MTVDTTKLRELAQKATPGEWYVSAPAEHAVWKDIGDRRYLIADTSDGFTDDNNSEYIAAANPSTVLALLDELDRLRTIEAAARNLAKVKGRHNSELAMNQLLEALKCSNS